MVCVEVIFIFLLSVFRISASNLNEIEQHTSQISTILKHLNSNPNKIYDYKKGTFISSQQKAEFLEVIIDVEVVCTVNYPGVPCSDQILTCGGFLQNTNDDYQVISEVLCRPKRESSVENVDEHFSINTPSIQDSKIELSHEAVSSEQNADFVAVKADSVPCLGCPFDLNTDIEGVSLLVDTALKHIESEKVQKQNAVKIIRLQQQVVAGIKYILTVEVAPTVCQKDVDLSSTNCPVDSTAGSSVCEIIFIQRPWISKEKVIIKNNCTISQEFTIENNQRTKNDISNEISTNPYINKPYYDKNANKNEDQMNPDRLNDLESQIVFVEPLNTKPALNKKIESDAYNKEVQYEIIHKNPYRKLSSDNIQKAEHPFVTQDQSSTPLNVDKYYFTDREQTDTLTNFNNEDNNNPVVSDEPTTLNSQTDNLRQNLNADEESNDFKEVNRHQRDIKNSPLEHKYKRFVRELKSTNLVSLDTSKSREGDTEESNSEESGNKRDINVTLHSSDSSADEIKENRKKRDIDNRKSLDSSGSQEDDSRGSSEEINGNKRKRDANLRSLDSSGSQEGSKDDTEESRRKRNVEDSSRSSESHEDDKAESISDSSKSDEDKRQPSRKLKRNISNNLRIKRKNDDDSNSSSSSSTASENESKKSKNSKENNENGNDNSSSSSSSSSSSENKNKEKKHNENDENHDRSNDSSDSSSDDKNVEIETHNKKDSDSSSSSSENNSREENEVRESDTSNRKVDIDINIRKVKRSIGQLEKISQEEKFLVRDLADFAASSLDSIDDDNHKRVILQILGAKKLKLDGIYYHITLRLGISQCSENEDDESCREKLFTNLTKICKVLVHVENDLSNPKVVKSQCQNIKKDDRDRNRTNYSRYRRYIDGSTDLPVDDVIIPDYLQRTPNSDKPALQDKNLGTTEKESSDNTKAFKYIKDVLPYLDNDSGHYNKLKIEGIVAVDKQVVAGELWRIKAELTLSDCPQTSSADPQLCNKLEGSEIRTCIFKIWDRAWLPKSKEVQATCETESKPYTYRFKRDIVDSKYIIPSSLNSDNEPNPKVLHFIKTGLQYLDFQSSHETKYIIKSIKKISKQTVAGVLWNVKADIVLSDCPKQFYTEYCEEFENSEIKTCIFSIWEKPWISGSTHMNITCDNDNTLYFVSPDSLKNINTLHFNELVTKFSDFRTKYNKTYLKNTPEFIYRFQVFMDNLRQIDLLNKYEEGTARYGITQFADLTAREFSKSHGLRMDLSNENQIPFANAIIPDIELPTEFDWRNKNAVTEVKNQQSCGSCWAFSTTGNIEGQYAIKYGKLLEFSEQELVDCDKLDEGCNGGLMDNAYRTIEEIGGLETESDYPYDAEDEKCHFNKSKVSVQLSGALNISHNEDDMAKWLVQNGPISIAINANAMQFYMGGISHPWKMLCNPKNLDHGVLVVGYGVHNYPRFNKTLPFWIVKNSWGTSWGEQGYYRVYRGDGTCGLNQTPSSGIVV